ncbi:MAG: arylsulfatase [Prolixibacteraceae bacterium]
MKLFIATFLSVLFFGCKTNSNEQQSSKQPNIVLILADDMGFSDIGCYGSEINTPNLDKLAAEGVRFSSLYNNARCCPTRAALITGLYPHQAGVGEMTDTDLPIPEYQGFLNDESVTIADVLGEVGYTSYLSGKWHLGDEPGNRPLDNGFDECFAFLNGAASYFDFKPYRSELWPPGNDLTVVSDNEPVSMEGKEFYATDLYTDSAVNFINKHSAEKPFFLYLPYTAPHWPLHALPEDIAKYEGKYDEGWNAIREKRYERLLQMGIIDETTKLSEKYQPDKNWEDLTEEEKEYETRLMEVHAAMIDRMDQNIGRILETLEKKGELNNTVILFLSDNGAAGARGLTGGKYGHPRFNPDALPGTPESFTGFGRNWANVSNTPFREFKSDIHEGGIATPFIAWYPEKFPAGKINHTVSHIVDVMPTLLELAGTTYPEEFEGYKIKPAEGKNLIPVITEMKKLEDQTYYFEHLGKCGVIDSEWKIVRFRDEPWELYNLKQDRSETNNLAEENPEKLNELAQKYDAWAEKNNVLPREKVEKKMIYDF